MQNTYISNQNRIVMSQQVRDLMPHALWNHFADINAIPRASKKEQAVVDFIANFGRLMNLDTSVDDAGNIVIRKPATKGMEHRETIILQSHVDMVHQKNGDTVFDFDTQGIEMYVDGDWVKARGTTLGADNGIGVATIMSLLASDSIPHPALEALFTTDEETGMTGAMSLKGGVLTGNILLNLDTEADNELTIGCAGGVDVTATGTYNEVAPMGNTALAITVKGLTGGHSGGDIHLGRANANKIMNRLLYQLQAKFPIELISLSGGSLRNAIPRESVAQVAILTTNESEVKQLITAFERDVKAEYRTTDPELHIQVATAEVPKSVMNSAALLQLIRSVYACPNGIYRMSPEIAGLVQSSNNVARVVAANGSYSVQCLTRSSVETEKYDLADAIKCAFEQMDAEVVYTGQYPGWQPRPDAAIVQLMSGLYQEMFGESAHVNAVHAGLECGILGRNYPNVQMISFGPNITGAHSPDEKVQISSVQKFWKYLLATLERIPEKKG